MSSRFRPAVVSLCTTVALLCSTSAEAVGDRIDVQIVDRDTGQVLTPVLHDGAWWVAGRPGARYGVLLNNAGAIRRLGVISIDGVNAVTGDTADWQQTGYVLAVHDSMEVDGWRKNADEVAAFTFTALPDSYAARTGRPADVGVIGVAVFDEARRVGTIMHRSMSTDREDATDRKPAERASLVDPAERTAVPAPSASPSRAGNAVVDPSRLGTGHGPIETSAIRFVDFERARPRPDEIVTIHYDRRERLIAMGILPSQPTNAARPFPGDDPRTPRFVPDPPHR